MPSLVIPGHCQYFIRFLRTNLLSCCSSTVKCLIQWAVFFKIGSKNKKIILTRWIFITNINVKAMIKIFLSIVVLFFVQSTCYANSCQHDGAGSWCGTVNNPYYVVSKPGTASQVHIFGNALINVIANRVGQVQVFNGYRGFAYFGSHVQGAYSYIKFKNKPAFSSLADSTDSFFQQKFTLNGVKNTIIKNGLEITHNISIKRNSKNPQKDQALVEDIVTLKNTSHKRMIFKHYEVWDSSYLSLTAPMSMVVPSKPWSFINKIINALREKFSSKFTVSEGSSKNGNGFSAHFSYFTGGLWGDKKHNKPQTKNLFLPRVSLSTSDQNTKFFDPTSIKQAEISIPEILRQRLLFNPSPVFIAEKAINLQPGQAATLHYQYRLQETINKKSNTIQVKPKRKRRRKPSLSNCIQAFRRTHTRRRSNIICTQLEREYNWKTQQLASWGLYRSYYGDVSVPQGSIYSYKVGFDQAPRDFEQTIPALSVTDHKLAEDTLQLVMSLQEANPKQGEGVGNFSNGFWGYGCAGDKRLGHCTAPNVQNFGVRSDFDQYFMWSFYQFYKSSDLDSFKKWLTEPDVAPYYPKPKNVTGSYATEGLNTDSPLDHLKLAFYHLRDSVGTGPHGLIKLKDGDWNDAILSLTKFESYKKGRVDSSQTKAEGESVVASEMVVNILPNVVNMLKKCDVAPNLQKQMLQFTHKIAKAIKKVAVVHKDGLIWFPVDFVWMDYNKLNPVSVDVGMGEDYINLMAQVWLLTNKNAINYGILTKKQAINLLNYMHSHLDTTQLGATFWDPSKPLPVPATEIYAITEQESWSSIRQLLTVAYNQFPETRRYAWDELYHTSFDWHALKFPKMWMGTLSGPDGWDVHTGRAWNYVALDQNVFPYANSNPNAMWSWAYQQLSDDNPSQ